MISPKLWIRYSIDGKPRSDKLLIDLLNQDSFLLPDPVGEYFKKISFDLEIPSSQDVSISAESGEKLERTRGNCYRLVVERAHGGIVGSRRVSLRITQNKTIYPIQIVIPIQPEHLKLEQFHTMLDDISHWIFFSLSAPVSQEIGFADRFSRSLRSQHVLLDLISKYMIEIKSVLQRIAASPSRKIQKEYYITSQKTYRQNSATVRWLQQNPDDTRALTYRNTSTYDVYENQFILFFLDQLEHRVAFLQLLVERTTEDKERELKREQSYTNHNQIGVLEQQIQEAGNLRAKCLQIIKELQQLRNIEFLRGVSFSASQFHLEFSLTLTQDFNYSRIWGFYEELGRNDAITRLDRVRRFNDALLLLGVKATHQIYEYWTFFAVYSELINLHFFPENEDGLISLITQDVLDPYLKPESSVILKGEKALYGDLAIHLYYDHAYTDRNGREIARPDITIEVRLGREITRFVFDAKYKTYSEAHVEKNSKQEFWHKDFVTLSDRYSKNGVIKNVQGAFLFHINASDKWFENYGGLIQFSERSAWKINAHRFGFIPVVPGNLMPLRTLLTMILLVKLGQTEADVCWTCGSTDVQKEVYTSHRYGTTQENKRVCQKCGNEWWVQHCGCQFPLFKGDFSFQVQHKAIQPHSNCDGYICPGCGKCVCGMSIRDM